MLVSSRLLGGFLKVFSVLRPTEWKGRPYVHATPGLVGWFILGRPQFTLVGKSVQKLERELHQPWRFCRQNLIERWRTDVAVG